MSTLKRHGYYCRARRNGTTIRPRSCTSCARRKEGCDHRRPKCSRCITRDVACYYPANESKSSGSRSNKRHDSLIQQRNETPRSAEDSPSISSRQGASNSLGDPSLDDTLDILDMSFPGLEAHDYVWDDLQINQYFHSPPSSIPRPPSSSVRKLVQRPRLNPGSQRTTKLILHTLKSYPLMMLRHNTLPPFIHPNLVYTDNTQMEALTNCISLVHMISSGIQGSRKLFWNNVRWECERFTGEVFCIIP